MGLTSKEKAFPRGGRKPAASLPRKGSFNLFDKRSRKRKNRNDKPKAKSIFKQFSADSKLKIHLVKPLSKKTLNEGMLILGCIYDIHEYDMTVALPGRLSGKVAVTNISEPYTNSLKTLMAGNYAEKISQLADMFKIGQFVAARVLEVNNDKVSLSLAPHVVQSDLTSTMITEGMVLVAAVHSVEEHGYIMDIGIKSMRAFLKKSSAQKYEDMWNNGRSLGIGQIVRCRVVKADVTFVKLSADPAKVCESEPNANNLSLDMLLPGTLLQAKIKKVIEDGLEVEFGNDFTGYVHRHHFAAPWDSPQKYKVDQVYPARVLYIVPLIKLVYVSLKTNICGAEPLSVPATVFNIGDVKKAKVKHVGSNGIELKLDEEAGVKGFVPLHHCGLPQLEEGNLLLQALTEKFKVDSKQKCRLLHFNYMEQFFICSLKKELLSVQYLQPKDFSVGAKVMCRIEKHEKTSTLVSVDGKGRVFYAHVPALHLGNVPLSHPEKKFPIGSQHKARVLSVAENKMFLTLKSTLVNSRAEALSNFGDFQKGVQCMGTVVLIKNNGLLVTFFGDVKGWVKLGKRAAADQEPAYFLGQLVTCYVVRTDKRNKKIFLSLNPLEDDERQGSDYEVGQMYNVTVKACTESIEVRGDKGRGIIPAQHLTDIPTMAPHLLKTYKPGETLQAYCFINTQPAILTVRPSLIRYFESTENDDRSSVKEGIVIPTAVKTISSDGITLRLPVSKSHLSLVKLKHLPHVNVESPEHLGLQKDQGLLIKIRKVKKHRYMNVTASLNECWDYTTEPCVSLMRNYWENYDRIAAHQKKLKNPIINFSPGEQVQGEVTAIEDYGAILQLKDDVRGIAAPGLCKKNLKAGGKVTGTVIFVDLMNNCIELALHPAVMKRINTKQDGKFEGGLGVGIGVRGEVLSVRPELVVVVLKAVGREQLAYIPTRHHVNDVLPDLSHYKIGAISKLVVEGMENGRIFCVQQRFTFELIKLKARAEIKCKKGKKRTHDETVDSGISTNPEDENSEGESVVKSKRQRLISAPTEVVKKPATLKVVKSSVGKVDEKEQEEEEEVVEEEEEEEEEESDNDEASLLKKLEAEALSSVDLKESGKSKHKRKSKSGDSGLAEVEANDKAQAETVMSAKKQKIENSKKDDVKEEEEDVGRLTLSSGFVWDADPNLLPAAMASDKSAESSSEEEEAEKQQQSKKKLTAKERRERARQEEERIRAAEQQYLDAEREPQTADEFDRLVLASPNSSLCWIKYMAFHLQATEIEKARAVAQRALSTISFREEQEKLNVWCAWLNLENLYGTKESLDKVLQDAVRMNDEFKVYMQMLKIYADSSKVQEAEKLVYFLTKKFKADKEMWLQCSEMLMKLGQLEKARLLLQKALASLDKKLHVEFICKFAYLENRYGESERGQTLMEHILTSYPKRVDVWCTYVDMLVKKSQLDPARNVLERAVVQKLPMRKMKTLFAKFLRFEEQHGTPEGVQRVRKMAQEYVEVTSSVTVVDEEDQE